MHWRLIDENESERYDNFIASAKNGDILQSYSWGEVKSDWHPLRGVVEDSKGTVLAASSLLIRKTPLFGRTIAYAPRGPVLSDYHNTDLLIFTLKAMTATARANGAILLKIDPTILDGDQTVLEPLKSLGFHPVRNTGEFGGLQPRYTFRLSLQGSIDEIFSAFKKKVRYKINYALKKGLTFRCDEETSIEDFFHVLSRTSQRGDCIARAPEYFHRLYSIQKKDNRILLLTGYIEGKPVVSSLTLIFGNTAWAVYGGQADDYRNYYAYHAMNWERIRWAHSRGAHWFDFYGVPGRVDESHPLYGLYHFKESFGGEYTAYIGEWDLVLSPSFYLLWESGIPLYRQAKRSILKILRR